jgi:DNA-directed RNA polymerase specialized sigma24 family protein
MATDPARLPDEALLVRCLQEDPHAWYEFYRRLHPLLLGHVVKCLRRCGLDNDIAEDVVSCLWVGLLCAGRLRLRLYRISRSPLRPYLLALSRRALWRYVRSLQSGLGEAASLTDLTAAELGAEDYLTDLELGDFLSKLPRRLREHCRAAMQPPGEQEAGGEPSPAARRQLVSRVRRRARDFFAD